MANMYNYRFEFINCNFENVIKGCLYYDNNTSGIADLIIEDCTGYLNIGNEILDVHPVTFKATSIINMKIINFQPTIVGGKTWDEVYSMPESTIHTNTLATSQLRCCYGNFTILSNTSLININNDKYIYWSAVGNSNIAVKSIKELQCDAFLGGRARAFYTADMSTNRYVNLRQNPILYDGIILTNAPSDIVLSYIYPNRVVTNNQNGMIFTIVNNSGYNITLNATTGYQQNYVFIDNNSTKVLANGETMCCCLIMVNGIAWLKELFTI